MVCVGLGAAGVFVPGLPTTIFLIAASWLFTRSCPWLEERLIRVPLFRPFLAYLRPDAPMPLRAVLVTLAVMWAAVVVSAGFMLNGEDRRPMVAATVAAAGLVGTGFVVRMGLRRGAFSRADSPARRLAGPKGELTHPRLTIGNRPSEIDNLAEATGSPGRLEP